MRSIKQLLVPALMGLLISMTTPLAQAACSTASLSGDFWFLGNGTVQQNIAGGNVIFKPFVEIGRVSYDGKGNASLVETVAQHTRQSQVQAKGTYMVSPDCRASVEWKLSNGDYFQSYALLVLQGGAELETVTFRTADSGGGRPLSTFTQRKF
jgi:hypothetical protein